MPLMRWRLQWSVVIYQWHSVLQGLVKPRVNEYAELKADAIVIEGYARGGYGGTD